MGWTKPGPETPRQLSRAAPPGTAELRAALGGTQPKIHSKAMLTRGPLSNPGLQRASKHVHRGHSCQAENTCLPMTLLNTPGGTPQGRCDLPALECT